MVCYEALTGRHPFQRARADEIVEAIRKQIPPPASEINPGSEPVDWTGRAQGNGKAAMPSFRQRPRVCRAPNKALRNEPIEYFDPSRTRPRLQRAAKALETGDYQFASEILGELEAEGHIDNSISALRH